MSASLHWHKLSETQRPSSTGSLLKMHLLSRPALSGRLIVLYGDAFPALIPPGLEYKPATTRLHPFPKPVRFRASTVVRLVRPLRHFLAPSKT